MGYIQGGSAEEVVGKSTTQYRRLSQLGQPMFRIARTLVWGWRLARLAALPDLPDLFRAYETLQRHQDTQRQPGGWHYKGHFYPDYLTVGGASYAIMRIATPWCQGRGIDIGAGLWPLPHAIPVDLWRGPGATMTIDCIADQSLDFVFSSHCLEHIVDWQIALSEWIGKLKPAGIIFLYLPHPDCTIWHPGSPFVGDDHKWIPRPNVIKDALMRLRCDIIAYDDGPDAMESFFVCGRNCGS